MFVYAGGMGKRFSRSIFPASSCFNTLFCPPSLFILGQRTKVTGQVILCAPVLHVCVKFNSFRRLLLLTSIELFTNLSDNRVPKGVIPVPARRQLREVNCV